MLRRSGAKLQCRDRFATISCRLPAEWRHAFRGKGSGWRSLAGQDRLAFTWPDSRPIHPKRLSTWFEQLARAAGLPRIRLHDVRHSYATAALAAGIPAKVVSERLGHASIAITMDTYSRVCSPAWMPRPPARWRG